jgi:hypothetical protein
MKKTTKTTPSVVSTSTPTPAAPGGFTLGLDLGDRSHYVCVLDATGRIVHEGPLPNDRAALAGLLTSYPAATVALEAGTHRPWISRHLTGLGATVIVANPRKLHAITRHERKCDRRDAQMLARHGALSRFTKHVFGDYFTRPARFAFGKGCDQPGHAGAMNIRSLCRCQSGRWILRFHRGVWV